jgi:hypothetical protein
MKAQAAKFETGSFSAIARPAESSPKKVASASIPGIQVCPMTMRPRVSVT